MARGGFCGLATGCLAFVLGGIVILLSPEAIAQSSASLTGSVTDSAGIGLSAATVTALDGSRQAITDERGEFRLDGLTPGPSEIRVRRLGFASNSQRLQLAVKDPPTHVHITLALLPSALSPVVVQAKRVQYAGRLAGYYQRLERHSSGVFIDRAELDRRNYRSLSQLLSQSPGVNAGRIYAGGGSVRMRGRSCRPLVWLDGVPMPAGEVDLDGFPVSTIQGVELYLGSTTAPTDYTMGQGQSSCGTILLWSRGPDTEPANVPKQANTKVETLTEARSVYTADQVERQAQLVNVDSLSLTYPPALFAAGVEGSVMAEFVVDSAGAIEPETFSVVSFTHPLFVDAVSRALERAIYSPAVKGGHSVRQLVHQPFSFIRRSAKTEGSGNN
jgi:hypothetical protein